jgi:predicted NUDIX family NTP pyrophosphohydrolase
MPLADVVPVGTDILWSIAYDTSWVNPHGCCTFPGGDVFYESDPLWWSITVGDYTAVNGLYHAMSIVGGTETRVQMDGSLSTFGLFGNPPVPGSTWSPMALDAAADITTQSGSFQLYWSYTAPGQSPPGPHGYMRGTFTDVRAVPEPSVLLLAALGASLIGVRHARLIRRRHQTSTTTH